MNLELGEILKGKKKKKKGEEGEPCFFFKNIDFKF